MVAYCVEEGLVDHLKASSSARRGFGMVVGVDERHAVSLKVASIVYGRRAMREGVAVGLVPCSHRKGVASLHDRSKLREFVPHHQGVQTNRNPFSLLDFYYVAVVHLSAARP